MSSCQATNLITKKELLTMDPDTDDGQLVYEITAEPKHGFLESKLKPGSPAHTFTQGTQALNLLHTLTLYVNISCCTLITMMMCNPDGESEFSQALLSPPFISVT